MAKIKVLKVSEELHRKIKTLALEEDRLMFTISEKLLTLGIKNYGQSKKIR